MIRTHGRGFPPLAFKGNASKSSEVWIARLEVSGKWISRMTKQCERDKASIAVIGPSARSSTNAASSSKWLFTPTSSTLSACDGDGFSNGRRRAWQPLGGVTSSGFGVSMGDDVRKRSVMWGNAFELTLPARGPEPTEPVSAIYKTKLGKLYQAKVEDFLAAKEGRALAGSTQLVFTSPPFPLLRKKRYGNLQGEEYIKWFSELAPKLKALLTPDGSIVVEIGNVWEPGHPVMSTVVLKALLEFLEKAGLVLCQEFVWYNPARLPSPIQWVNVERVRVKDGFSRVWWMAATERPKADNRKVLKAYSSSMEKLLKRGTYNSGARPSQHSIGKTSFNTRHNGAIPPSVIGADDVPALTTLLKASNTKSSEDYQKFCRASEEPAHPARMPGGLAEFFIKFLTDEGDLVFDPFGGSNTTGAVAQALGRRWVTTEARWDYAVTSLGRFEPKGTTILTPTVQAAALG